MRKNYIYFFIFLLLGIISCNAFVNMLAYNFLIRTVFEYGEILRYIFLFGATGIISFLFSKIYKKIVIKNKRDVIDDENQEIRHNQEKKLKKILIASNMVGYIGFSIVNFFMNALYLSDLELINQFGNFYPVIVIITIILINFVTLIPSNIVISRMFRKKEKSNKIILKLLRVVGKILFILIFLEILCMSVYYYIDIPEFKNVYEIYNDEVGVFGCYQDVRKTITAKEFIVPEKIWGKKVTEAGSFEMIMPDTKIYLPSTISFDSLLYLDVENEIEMYGEPITWFIKDNVVYDIDETRMIVLDEYDKDIIYIPESVCSFFINPKNQSKEIEIAENNPYFYVDGNTIWAKGERTTLGGHVMYDMSWMNMGGYYGYNKKDITIPEHMSGDIFLWQSIDTINIPKHLNNKIIFKNFIMDINQFEVEEGNELYSTYQGNLYNKEKTNLLAVKNMDAQYDTLVLPNTLESFENEEFISKVAAHANTGKIKIDKLMEEEGLVFENNMLYNKQIEKILISADRICRIGKNTKEIDENMLKYYIKNQSNGTLSFEVDEENPYFTLYEGHLYNKEKTELLHIDFSQDNIILPKELERMNTFIEEALFGMDIVLEDGNNYFTIYENNLYTSDRKRLIAVSKTSFNKALDAYNIKLPKELEEIKEKLLKKMMFSTFELEEGSDFTLYKGNLYNKDKSMLIAFGKTEDNIIIFAKEMKEINKHALDEYSSRYIYNYYNYKTDVTIKIEEDNKYFSVKDNCLYNKDMTKLIMISNYYCELGEEIQIDGKLIEIDETIMNYYQFFENFKVSPNNKYIREIVENYIIYKKEYQSYMKK